MELNHCYSFENKRVGVNFPGCSRRKTPPRFSIEASGRKPPREFYRESKINLSQVVAPSTAFKAGVVIVSALSAAESLESECLAFFLWWFLALA